MNTIIKPFISLDIETTGLKRVNPYVLEIGMIFEDLGYFGSNMRLDIIVDNGELDPKRCEENAMAMNKRVFDAIKNKQDNVFSLEEAQLKFKQFINQCYSLMQTDETYFRGKLQFAGKNVGPFDMAILEDNDFDLSRMCHRAIDVGSLYLSDFGEVPSFAQVLKKLGLEKVDHIAINDAEKAAYAIKHKLNML